MQTVIVLGAGMVGSVMAADLASDFRITIADSRQSSLDAAVARSGKLGLRITPLQVDLSDAATLKKAVASFDLVVGALSSRIGFGVLRAVIEAGKNYCDISFFAQNALDLDALAKEHHVTAVVDCGVAPGMSNMICGAEVAEFERAGGTAESLAIYVGGLPRHPEPPYYYKAAFAPSDVIEEYTRPVRLVEGGRTVIKEALTEPEFLEFAGVGRLEAVNTDGLRSIADTLSVPNMKEKTLRYPGHYDLMRGFKDAGLFSEEEIEVGGKRLRPRDVTAAIMFPKWTYGPGEEDLTVMRIIAEGVRAGKRERVTWDLADHFHTATGATSMSRTTGLACTTVARMVAAGSITRRGVVVPERLGEQGVLPEVVRALRAKGIVYTRTSESIA